MSIVTDAPFVVVVGKRLVVVGAMRRVLSENGKFLSEVVVFK